MIMRKKIRLICLVSTVCVLLASCIRESHCEFREERASLSVTVEGDAPSKSSTIVDESLVRDMNVWVFSSDGTLKETHYFDALSIRTTGSVSFDTSTGGHSRLVVIGNAGRELQAPESSGDRVTFTQSYPLSSSGAVLMVGESALAMTSTGLRATVILSRAMSRIALKVSLAPSLTAIGASLGSNVRILEAGFCNSPAVFSFVPTSIWESVRTFKAAPGTAFQTGDRLSAGDISTLQTGGTVYLYSLPNYTDVPYSDRPSDATTYASYIEMKLSFDALGSVGGGTVLCRFYANDGSRIGLMGGCSYTCQVIVSNDGASNTWRKDDFRFDNPEDFLAGQIKTVSLHSQTHPEASVSFSLSSVPGVSDNGTFRLGEKVTGSSLSGVRVTALASGTGTLYCFDSGGAMMGSVPLRSVYPVITVSDKQLDVTGNVASLNIQGLDAAYASRASDELFESLYGVVSILPHDPVSGIHGDDFIHAGADDGNLYVNRIRWSREGLERNWTEAVGKTFPYRVTLACGITADFQIGISNAEVGLLDTDTYFGEAFDMTMIDNPLPAISALGAMNNITAVVSATVPQSLCGGPRAWWQGNGWRSWYGGSLLEDGYVADDYLTALNGSSLRWDLPTEAVRNQYGDYVPLYIGKLNPHCSEYVKAMAGYYSSTIYYPTGVDLFVEKLGFYNTPHGTEVIILQDGKSYTGYSFVNITTCLCFRPHNNDSMLDIEDGQYAYQGRDGGAAYSGYSGIGINGCYYHSNGGFLETDWDGEMDTEALFSTTDFSYAVKAPYSLRSFGGRLSKHLPVYYYSPYTSFGEHALIADSDGHVARKGVVSVEKWSVSSKAYFVWPAEDFYMVNPREDG